MKFLRILTVSTLMLIAFGMACAFDLPIKKIKGIEYYYYIVGSNESLFNISQKLGVERNDIIRHNPQALDGVRAADILYFPVAEFKNMQSRGNATDIAAENVGTHIVKKGESVYAISRHYGMTPAQLIALNPSAIDGIRPGDALVVDLSAMPQTSENIPSEVAHENAQTIAQPQPIAENVSVPFDHEHNDRVPVAFQDDESDNVISVSDDADNDSVIEDKSHIRIALLLPFMLDAEHPTRQALHYTDFLKGFLMGVESSNGNGRPLDIIAFDTRDNDMTLDSILSLDEMHGVSLIVAPDRESQILRLAEYSDTTGALVLNLFAVRNTAHVNYSRLIQGNIPHNRLYDKATEAFIDKYRDYIPVFPVDKKSEDQSDKSAFINALQARLKAEDRQYITLEFAAALTENDLSSLSPDSKYVFVPNSSSRAELLKLTSSLTELREKTPGADNIRIFGYPEWMLFRGELRKAMHRLNACVYSRFDGDYDGFDARRLQTQFKQWYGENMINTAPMQAIWGYDTAKWAIEALNNFTEAVEDTNYKGVQSSFRFPSVVDGENNNVNESIYFIDYLPDGTTESIEF